MYVYDGDFDFHLPAFQMIVETDSLAKASPDMLCENSLIYFEQNLITPMGIVKSSYGQNIKMFELFLLPLLAFLREMPCIVQVSDLEITMNVIKLL